MLVRLPVEPFEHGPTIAVRDSEIEVRRPHMTV